MIGRTFGSGGFVQVLDENEDERLGLVLRNVISGEPNVEARVQKYYLPTLYWIADLLGHSSVSPHVVSPRMASPMIIGMNGPQGCGKSTLTRVLVEGLRVLGLRATTLSIDDFYLTREEQVKLAQANPLNPLLQQRGYPGTHDVDLGFKVLCDLKGLRQSGSVSCPVYDKSQFNGKGDRLPPTDWKQVQAPIDLILFEGWMLGFTPVLDQSRLNGAERAVNALLERYQCWNSLLDGFIQLIPKEISYIEHWRVEAEERMKAQGKAGMALEEIRRYIRLFLPAYENYLPQLTKNPQAQGHSLQIVLSQDRLPIGLEGKSLAR